MAKRKRLISLAVIFLALALALAACATPTGTPTPTPLPTSTIGTPNGTPSPTLTPTPTTSTPPPTQTTFPLSIPDVVEKVEPAVAFITVEYISSGFFGRVPATKSGSGMVLSPDGLILTNQHVIADALQIDVNLPGEREVFPATIRGEDPLSDLAVIQLEGQNFPYVSFGDASQLRVGDWVVAIGNALGLEGGPSVTTGIVSNLDRTRTFDDAAYYDIIQTDAAINPGNSGGPLVNLRGEVVGINTFVATQAQNIGFSVSANTARRVFEDLVQFGRVRRPFMGVTLDTVTPAMANELGLAQTWGVIVVDVEPGSPAAQAGLRLNDVIVEFEGQEVDEATHLIKEVWGRQIGERTTLVFFRGSERLAAQLTLAERPS